MPTELTTNETPYSTSIPELVQTSCKNLGSIDKILIAQKVDCRKVRLENLIPTVLFVLAATFFTNSANQFRQMDDASQKSLILGIVFAVILCVIPRIVKDVLHAKSLALLIVSDKNAVLINGVREGTSQEGRRTFFGNYWELHNLNMNAHSSKTQLRITASDGFEATLIEPTPQQKNLQAYKDAIQSFPELAKSVAST